MHNSEAVRRQDSNQREPGGNQTTFLNFRKKPTTGDLLGAIAQLRCCSRILRSYRVLVYPDASLDVRLLARRAVPDASLMASSTAALAVVAAALLTAAILVRR